PPSVAELLVNRLSRTVSAESFQMPPPADPAELPLIRLCCTVSWPSLKMPPPWPRRVMPLLKWTSGAVLPVMVQPLTVIVPALAMPPPRRAEFPDKTVSRIVAVPRERIPRSELLVMVQPRTVRAALRPSLRIPPPVLLHRVQPL